jgi:hypothetical protein
MNTTAHILDNYIIAAYFGDTINRYKYFGQSEVSVQMRVRPLVFCLGVLIADLTLAANNPVPVLNQPTMPTSVVPGGPGFTLTVKGTGFASGAVVNWNGGPRTTNFISASQLTASIVSSDIAAPGTASITVTNPPPGGGESNTVFLPIANSVAAPTFTILPPYPSFPIANSILTADFRGNGKLDLAYVGSTPTGISSSLVIQMGNGDGSFQSPVNYPVGTTPQSLIAFDFNGDGKMDLAVANTQDNTVSVLLGNGDGTFQSGATFPTLNAPQFLLGGDFNGDGKLDLAVGCRFGDSGDVGGISIFLGNGDGTFQHKVDYLPGESVFNMVAGDFNGDGKIDLVFYGVSGGSATLSFLQGNGDGTFQAALSVQGDPSTTALVAADLNGDGKLDLIAADLGGGAFVLLGNGDGTFQPPVGYGSGRSSVAVALGDFNADGKLDVALANQDENTFSILLGNGDGTLQNPMDFPAQSSMVFLTAGDFNNDGRMDLATITVIGGGPYFAQVFLQGIFPAASISPSSLKFAQLPIGTSSSPQIVTLKNTGTATLVLSNINITGANPSDFAQTNACGATLALSASCQISVTFTPTTGGPRSAFVTITDDAPGSPQTIGITGSGPSAPVAGVSPSSLTFSTQYVGTSGLPQTVTLTNSGSAVLNIASVTATPGDFGVLSACSNSLAAGQSCSIGVFFDPTSAGAKTGSLTITDNSANSPQTVSLSGTGQDFLMTASGAASATIMAGQTATYSIAVAPAGGFSQSVTLSCSGAAASSTCTVTPTTVQLNGTSTVMASIAVTTAARRFAVPHWPVSGLRYHPALQISALLGMSLLLIGLLFWKRKKQFKWTPLFTLATVLVCFGMTVTACGGGSGGSGGSTGTQAGTYTITTSGSFTSGSTTLTHTTKLTLVVQ